MTARCNGQTTPFSPAICSGTLAVKAMRVMWCEREDIERIRERSCEVREVGDQVHF